MHFDLCSTIISLARENILQQEPSQYYLFIERSLCDWHLQYTQGDAGPVSGVWQPGKTIQLRVIGQKIKVKQANLKQFTIYISMLLF